MTAPHRSPRRGPSHLLLRIYLVGLAQLVLVGAVLASAWTLVVRVPWQQTLGRFATYLGSEWSRELGQPEALQASVQRVWQQLEVRATVRTSEGRLLATSVSPPFEPPPRELLERLGSERMLLYGRPPVALVALPPSGPVQAYASLALPRLQPPAVNGVLLVVLVLACTGVTSVVFARMLAVPLQRLAAVARELGTGRLEARTGLRRGDELGEVAEAFDEMAERLSLLLRSQKELLANVSHELRTPLSRIRVALDLAAEGDAELARQTLLEIAGDLSELERLVEDVLTAARLDLATGASGSSAPPLRLEQVEAQSLVDKASARFRSAWPRHALEVRTEGVLPTLQADPVLLRRVLDNLLDNAGKYSEPSTTVRLELRPQGQGLEVAVRDEGIGIEAEDLRRVSTPFFRTDRSRSRATGGVGLGLALARRITEAHGGTLSLESQPGVGTTVRVLLPGSPFTHANAPVMKR